MGKKRIAINGFGRIGRNVFRNLLEDSSVEVVAINDLTDNGTLAHLLKYDSIYGVYDKTVTHTDTHITVGGQSIVSSDIRNPEELPWKELNIDLVVECTGIFRTEESAGKHITAGANRVLLSAPGKGGGIKTIVLGVNHEELSDDNIIVSNASCTTNCLSPVVKIINDNWGIINGYVSTIHGYTSDQRIHDAPHSDLRRARAAALNMIPTSTGAAVATGIVIPAIKGKLGASAIRIPIPTGSLIEMTVNLEKGTTVEDVNAKFKEMAEGPMKGILAYCVDPIVSTDIVGDKHSSIFDSLLTSVNGNMLKVTSWYDNEAGYSKRLAELAADM